MSRMIHRARLTRLDDESGISLVEMMVAILILGIALAGFANVLIGTLQTTTKNEQEVAASAVAQQSVEQLQATEWQMAGLYEDEMSAATLGLSYPRWAARVDTTDADKENWTLDGEPLYVIDGPGGQPRDPKAPLPSSTQDASGVTFTIDRYVTLIDRDANGTLDTRHFVTFITWTDRFGTARELRFESERSPTRVEAQATLDTMRAMYFYVAPTTVDLDSNAKPTRDVQVLVAANRPIAAGKATLSWDSMTAKPTTAPWLTTKQVNTISMSPILSSQRTLDGFTGFTQWTATIDRSLTYYDGDSNFSFLGEDANPDPALPDAKSTRTVTYRNGGFLPPPGGLNPTPATSPAAEISLYSPVIKGSAVLCTNPTLRSVTTPFKVTIKVKSLVVAPDNVTVDGRVFVTYTRRATKYSTQTTAERVSASYVGKIGGASDQTEWAMTIPAGAGFWLAGDTLEFTIQAERPSDKGSAMFANAESVTVASC